MRKKLHILIPLAAISVTPSIAFAEAAPVLVSAGNGPWIALAVVGIVRAVLGLGQGSFFDE